MPQLEATVYEQTAKAELRKRLNGVNSCFHFLLTPRANTAVSETNIQTSEARLIALKEIVTQFQEIATDAESLFKRELAYLKHLQSKNGESIEAAETLTPTTETKND